MPNNDPRFEIAEHYGIDIQMQQLIEEMSELTKAICKYFRSNGKGQPIPDYTKTTVKENLIEELADVRLLLDQVVFLLDCNEEVLEVTKQKINKVFGRMGNDASN